MYYPINEGLTKIRGKALSGIPTSNQQLQTARPLYQQPYAYQIIQEQLQEACDQGKRVLVLSNDHWTPQSAVVVKLDKVFERFALGHLDQHTYGAEDGDVKDVRIPYTINFAIFMTKGTKDRIEIED